MNDGEMAEDGVARQPNDAQVARLLDTLGSEPPPAVPPGRRDRAVQAALAAYDAAGRVPDLANRRLVHRARWQVAVTGAAAAAVFGAIIGGLAAAGGFAGPSGISGSSPGSAQAGTLAPPHRPAAARPDTGGHQATGVHAGPRTSGMTVQLRLALGDTSCPVDYPGSARPLPPGAAGVVAGPAAGSLGCLRVGPTIVTGRLTAAVPNSAGNPAFLVRLSRPVRLPPRRVVAVTDRGVALGVVRATGSPGVVVLREEPGGGG
jgi:hypothetical protein